MGTLALGVTAWEAGSRRHLWEPQAFWPHPEISGSSQQGRRDQVPVGSEGRDPRPALGDGPQRRQNGGGGFRGASSPQARVRRCSLQLLPRRWESSRPGGVTASCDGQSLWARKVSLEDTLAAGPPCIAQGLRGHQGGSRWLQGWPWN